MKAQQTQKIEFAESPPQLQTAADLHRFTTLAWDITLHPETVTDERVRTTLACANSRREYLDAVGVMFAFNFITRVANALGVEPEMPRWMRRWESVRQFGLRLMASAFRLTVDLRNRRIAGPDVQSNEEAIRRLFRDMGFSEPPEWLWVLREAPPILATIRECLEAILRRGAEAPALRFSPPMFLAIAEVVLVQVPNASQLARLVSGWYSTNERVALEPVLEKFVIDLNTQSRTITWDRIQELRAHNYDDATILDLTIAAALWHAVARCEILVRAIQPVESKDQPKEGVITVDS